MDLHQMCHRRLVLGQSEVTEAVALLTSSLLNHALIKVVLLILIWIDRARWSSRRKIIITLVELRDQIGSMILVQVSSKNTVDLIINSSIKKWWHKRNRMNEMLTHSSIIQYTLTLKQIRNRDKAQCKVWKPMSRKFRYQTTQKDYSTEFTATSMTLTASIQMQLPTDPFNLSIQVQL